MPRLFQPLVIWSLLHLVKNIYQNDAWASPHLLLFPWARRGAVSFCSKTYEYEIRWLWEMLHRQAFLIGTRALRRVHVHAGVSDVGCGFGCHKGRAWDQRRPLLPRAREANHSFHFPFQLLSVIIFFPQETFLFPAVVKGNEGQHVSCLENFISSFINSQHFTVGDG